MPTNRDETRATPGPAAGPRAGSPSGAPGAGEALTLYGFQRSTYVNVARLVLTTRNVPFAFHDTEDEMGTPAHLARHPFDRVPVLQHGDFRLYETAAIVQYVDEAFPGPSLQPADVRERACMHQWISNLNAYFYPNIVFRLVHETVVFPELGIAPDEAVVRDALPRVEHALSVLERHLGDGRPYIASAAPSLADYFVLPNFWSLSFAPAGPALTGRFPFLSAWVRRMNERPEVQRFRATLPPRAPVQHARNWALHHRAKAG